MCGRYVSVARMAELIEQYKATGSDDGTERVTRQAEYDM